MFNRSHTSIFEIFKSYLNFYRISHLGKVSQLSFCANLVQYFECEYSRFPYSREGIDFTSVLSEKPIRVKQGFISKDYVIRMFISDSHRYNFYGS
jgi:hypothetical protein